MAYLHILVIGAQCGQQAVGEERGVCGAERGGGAQQRRLLRALRPRAAAPGPAPTAQPLHHEVQRLLRPLLYVTKRKNKNT